MMPVATLTLLLAQASLLPSPSASACPPTEVKRIEPTNAGDPEWHGRNMEKWCTGISCKVVEVLVTVNADGTVKDAVVKKGWTDGDNYNVLQTARNSKYLPATVNCKPVEGTYIFRELLTRID